MCWNLRKKNYCYLSMCACCNIISKFSSRVKKHIQHSHNKNHLRHRENLVIPILIKNQYWKNIKLSLDKGKMNKLLKSKNLNLGNTADYCGIKDNMKVEREVSKKSLTGKSVNCTVCLNIFLSVTEFLKHLEADDHRHVKVRFKCLECHSMCSYIKDMEEHSNSMHGKSDISQSCEIHVENILSASKKLQCPYCNDKFTKSSLLQNHVCKGHSKFIQRVTVKMEVGENTVTHGQGSQILIYRCMHCDAGFHTTQDVVEHTQSEHDFIPELQSDRKRPTRTRKIPKRLEIADNEGTARKNKKKTAEHEAVSINSDVTTGIILKQKVKVNKSKETNNIAEDVEKLDDTIKNKVKEVSHSKARQKLMRKNSKPKRLQTLANKTKSLNNPEYSNVNKAADKVESVKNAESNDVGEPELGDSDDDCYPDRDVSDLEVKKIAEEEITCKTGCEICGKVGFKSKQQLIRHARVHHNSGITNEGEDSFVTAADESGESGNIPVQSSASSKVVTRYKCPYCTFRLHHRDYVKSHVHKCHPEVKNYKLNDLVKETLRVTKNEVETADTFKCPNTDCQYTNTTKAKIAEHCKSCKHEKHGGTHSKIECILPDVWIRELENTIHLECCYCSVMIHGKTNFEHHMKLHLPDNEVGLQLETTLVEPEISNKKQKQLECSVCPYCEFVASQKVNVVRHMKRFHSNLDKTAVLQCVISDPTSRAVAKLQIRGTEQEVPGRSHSQAYDNMGNEHELGLEQTKLISIQSSIESGQYACPICDNFKTYKKKEVVSHMTEKHSTSDPDTDALYFIPHSSITISYNGNRDLNKIEMKCSSCDFTSKILTMMVRHMQNSHKVDMLQEAEEMTDAPDSLQPLVKLETRNIDLNKGELFERQRYKCRICRPDHNVKSKKGLTYHMMMHHTDQDVIDIHDTMYKMIDAVVGNSCTSSETHVCCLREYSVPSRSEFIKHYENVHHERLKELLEHLKTMPTQHNEADEEQIVCELCKREFTDSQSLKQHLIFHVNRYKWQCTYCNMHYVNAAELENHNSTVHAISGEMCHICGAMFQTNSVLTRHVRTHRLKAKDKRELCQHCGASILSSSLKKHIADMHIEKISCDCAICNTQEVPEELTAFNCKLCSKVFCHKYVLKAHMFKNHNESYPTGAYKCDKCSLSFSSKKMQLVHNHGCNKSEKSSKENCTQTLGVEKFATEFDKTMNSQNHLHYFPDLTQIKDTIQVDKNRDKPYMCKICQKGFSSSKRVREHIKRSHTKEENKKFRCKICKKGFMVRSECLVHCKSHFSDRKFDCKICGKRFKAAHHLKEHGAIHSENAEGAFLCRICGKGFKQRGSLVAHVGYHDKLKPFKCIFCKKGFTLASDLQRHMNRYFKDLKGKKIKELKHCHVCNQEFQSSHILKDHFESHIPFNPFQCSVCEERFASFRHMYTHKARNDHFLESEIEEGKGDQNCDSPRFNQLQKERNPNVNKKKQDEEKLALLALVADVIEASSNFNEDDVRDHELDEYGSHIVEVETTSLNQSFDKSSVHIDAEYEEAAISDLLEDGNKTPLYTNSVESSQSHTSTVLPETFKARRVAEQRPSEEPSGGQYNQHLQASMITSPDEYLDRASYYSDPSISRPSQTRPFSLGSSTFSSYDLHNSEHNAGAAPTYQTEDGSMIHVCVIKPDESR